MKKALILIAACLLVTAAEAQENETTIRTSVGLNYDSIALESIVVLSSFPHSPDSIIGHGVEFKIGGFLFNDVSTVLDVEKSAVDGDHITLSLSYLYWPEYEMLRTLSQSPYIGVGILERSLRFRLTGVVDSQEVSVKTAMLQTAISVFVGVSNPKEKGVYTDLRFGYRKELIDDTEIEEHNGLGQRLLENTDSDIEGIYISLSVGGSF